MEYIRVSLMDSARVDASKSDEDTQLVAVVPGKKLTDCLESYLTSHGIPVQCAEFMLEKSTTPIPGNSDAKFLAGHKINVRVKPGGTWSKRRASQLAALFLSAGKHSDVATSNSKSNSANALKNAVNLCAEDAASGPSTSYASADDARSSEPADCASAATDGVECPEGDKRRSSSSSSCLFQNSVNAASSSSSSSMLSRKSSFTSKKILNKPRSLSTCPSTSTSSHNISSNTRDDFVPDGGNGSLGQANSSSSFLSDIVAGGGHTAGAAHQPQLVTSFFPQYPQMPPPYASSSKHFFRPNSQSAIHFGEVNMHGSLASLLSNNFANGSGAKYPPNHYSTRKSSLTSTTAPGDGFVLPPGADEQQQQQCCWFPPLPQQQFNDGMFSLPLYDNPAASYYHCTTSSDDYATRRARSQLAASHATTAGKPATGGGTISAGTTGRKGIFSSKEKLSVSAEKTYASIIANRLNDLSVLNLESHWSELVRCSKPLTKRASDQQEAIWEIITTERRYINLLQNMEDLMLCFMELQKQGFLRDINSRRVFLNYSELLRCNLAFWKRAILPLLNESRKTGGLLNPKLLMSGFDSIVDWSRCYVDFNVGHSDCHSYVQKKQKENEAFAEFIKWAELHSVMNRQTLLDTLSTPMQRITRYSLLLKAILKTTNDADERFLIQSMIDNADAATLKLNYELNNNDLRIQLAEIMKTFESYDVVDTEEFERLFQIRSVHHHLNLLNPMPFLIGPPRYRRIYTKGDLKMRENRQSAKQDIHCILFTDMFLICKLASKRADRLRVIKPPIHVCNTIVHPFSEGNGFYLICKNEFGSISHLLLMFTNGTEETKRWAEMMSMAQDEFYALRASSASEFESHASTPFEHDVPHKYQAYGGGTLGNHFNASRRPAAYNDPDDAIIRAAAVQGIAHRKSHSMDSHVLAAASSTSDGSAHPNVPGDANNVSDHALLSKRPGSVASTSFASNGLMSHNAQSSDQLYYRNVAHDTADMEFPIDEMTNSAAALPPTSCSMVSSVISDNSIPEGPPTETAFSALSSHLPQCKGHKLIKGIDGGDAEPGQSTSFSDTTQPMSASPSPSGRRFEKRYHTIGELDGSIKQANRSGTTVASASANGGNTVGSSGGSAIPPNGSILKRFSWNVSSAMSGSSRKISSKFNEMNGRRFSHSTASSNDSFGSSTSGISTASCPSQDAGVTPSHAPTASLSSTDSGTEVPVTCAAVVSAHPIVTTVSSSSTGENPLCCAGLSVTAEETTTPTEEENTSTASEAILDPEVDISACTPTTKPEESTRKETKERPAVPAKPTTQKMRFADANIPRKGQCGGGSTSKPTVRNATPVTPTFKTGTPTKASASQRSTERRTATHNKTEAASTTVLVIDEMDRKCPKKGSLRLSSFRTNRNSAAENVADVPRKSSCPAATATSVPDAAKRKPAAKPSTNIATSLRERRASDAERRSLRGDATPISSAASSRRSSITESALTRLKNEQTPEKLSLSSPPRPPSRPPPSSSSNGGSSCGASSSSCNSSSTNISVPGCAGSDVESCAGDDDYSNGRQVLSADARELKSDILSDPSSTHRTDWLVTGRGGAVPPVKTSECLKFILDDKLETSDI